MSGEHRRQTDNNTDSPVQEYVCICGFTTRSESVIRRHWRRSEAQARRELYEIKQELKQMKREIEWLERRSWRISEMRTMRALYVELKEEYRRLKNCTVCFDGR